MVPWIFVHNPLEYWLEDYPRIFDAWEDGGVGGIIVGRLWFADERGIPLWGEVLTPAFAADPAEYAAFGINPPPATPRNLAKEQKLHALLDDAARRGWRIMIFDSRDGLRLLYQRGQGTVSGLVPAEDPVGAVEVAAGVRDIMAAFPQAHGVVLDQPGEHDYELEFHRGTALLELSDLQRWRFEIQGADVARIERGQARLRRRMRTLTPGLVRYLAPGGMLGALELFDVDEDVLYWLRVRRQTALDFMARVRTELDDRADRVVLGGIPRTAAFSGLTGQDFSEMAAYFDFVFPKHYFWHRGNDGLYGTVARWVQQVATWNPELEEADCFAVVKAWLGLELPGIDSLADMELGFPEQFFAELVYAETRRALEAVSDAERVIPWVSTGRCPHGGEAMPARDLDGILKASQRAGATRFLFQPDPDLGAGEWSVISRLCGRPWRPSPQGYWPADSTRPDSYGE